MVLAAYTGQDIRLGDDWSASPLIESGHVRIRLFFCAAARHAVIAIAGTDEKADWAYNVASDPVIRPMPCDNGQSRDFTVHGGFLKYAEVVRGAIAGFSGLPFNFHAYMLTIAGHSLGGAAAVLLPAVLADSPLPMIGRIERVITFGAPKAIHGRDCPFYPWPATHFRSVDDLVPLLPVSTLRSPWGQPGQSLFVSSKEINVWGGSSMFWIYRRCVGAIRSVRDWRNGFQSLRAHSLAATYIPHLRAARLRELPSREVPSCP